MPNSLEKVRVMMMLAPRPTSGNMVVAAGSSASSI